MSIIRSTIRSGLDTLDKLMHFDVAYAHCDVPCGIYDPHAAQVAAHTVIRMDMLIADAMKAGPNMTAEDRNKMIRCIAVKEEHAEIVKHEVTVLWGDYFKPDYAKEHPELHELVFNTLKLASKAKQGIDIKDADALLESVEEVAEVFWKSKGVETKRVKSFYPTEREFVYPKV